MMPKAIESEKKICEKAAIHTPASARAPHFGVKNWLSPSEAPGRNIARTTRARNMMVSSGRNSRLASSTPRVTPRAMTIAATTQIARSGQNTPPTTSRLKAGSPSWRYSPTKKPTVSSPHARFTENIV